MSVVFVKTVGFARVLVPVQHLHATAQGRKAAVGAQATLGYHCGHPAETGTEGPTMSDIDHQHGVHPGLAEVRARIAAAEREASRPAGSVTLVTVSKTFDAEAIRPVLASGHRVFGENRVQEAQAKWPRLRAEFADVALHLIGPLQTNKARDAVTLFDCIQSLDRPKLARVLAEEMAAQGRRLRLFVQVNTGEEAQKAGILPDDVDGFLRQCADDYGLAVDGLMCIPPVDEEPALHFALLASIAARNGLQGLSMGMSGDFELSIALGATHVRVGSAIFGHRPPPTGEA
jgi:PLP dependent protein